MFKMKKTNKKIKIKNRSFGINLISVFFTVMGLGFILQSFLLSLIIFIPDKVQWIGLLFNLSFNQQIIGIILFLIAGLFCIILSLNLFRLKSWARVSAILFSIASLVALALMAIKYSLPRINFIAIILNILILIYLENKKVREAFN